jgi:MFS family permease
VVESIGWRGTMTALGLFAILLSILLFVLVPHRTSEQKHVELKAGILDGLKAVAANAQTWLCALIGFGMAAIMLGFGALWGVPWLSNVHGYSTVEAAGVISMLFAGWAIFSPLVGWVSDKVGRRNPILTGGAIISLLAFSVVIFRTPENTALLMGMIFLTGVGGCAMTVCFSSVKELNSLEYSSTGLGLMNMCVVGAGAVMQPMIGWLLDMNWAGTIVDGARVYTESAYTLAFVSLLVVNIVALIGSLLLRETRCKQLV